jgi:hypothetical protein
MLEHSVKLRVRPITDHWDNSCLASWNMGPWRRPGRARGTSPKILVATSIHSRLYSDFWVRRSQTSHEVRNDIHWLGVLRAPNSRRGPGPSCGGYAGLDTSHPRFLISSQILQRYSCSNAEPEQRVSARTECKVHFLVNSNISFSRGWDLLSIYPPPQAVPVRHTWTSLGRMYHNPLCDRLQVSRVMDQVFAFELHPLWNNGSRALRCGATQTPTISFLKVVILAFLSSNTFRARSSFALIARKHLPAR